MHSSENATQLKPLACAHLHMLKDNDLLSSVPIMLETRMIRSEGTSSN